MYTTTVADDYGTPVPQLLVFNVGTTRLCTDITTVDDEVYEDTESFRVSISLINTNDNIEVTVPTATVLITDDDCKLECLCVGNCKLNCIFSLHVHSC